MSQKETQKYYLIIITIFFSFYDYFINLNFKKCLMRSYHIVLKNIRKDLKMSQEEVAQALHIQPTTYSKIERGMIQLTLNRLLDLSKVFNLSPEDILSYGKRKEKGFRQTAGNITYVPIHAQAGFLDNFADQSKQEDYLTFSIPTFTEKDLYMISVEGDSMFPTIIPGTFIIIKVLKDKRYIKWGEPHVVVTTDGRVVKRILKSHDPECVTLYSDNKLYQPYDLPKNYVLSLWQVYGKISKSFAPQILYDEFS